MNPKTLKSSTVVVPPEPRASISPQSQNSSSQHTKLWCQLTVGRKISLHLKHPGLYSVILNKHQDLCISAKCLNCGTLQVPNPPRDFFEFHAHLEKKQIQQGQEPKLSLSNNKNTYKKPNHHQKKKTKTKNTTKKAQNNCTDLFPKSLDDFPYLRNYLCHYYFFFSGQNQLLENVD